MAEKSKKSAGRSERESERREVILRAAVEVFSRKGYSGCRIQDVAKEAGVAYGLVYHYFQNKDELLESVFSIGWAGFLKHLRAEIEREQHISGRVRGIVHVAFEAYRRDPRAVKVLILEVGRSPAGGSVNRGGAFTEVILSAAQMFRQAQMRGEVPVHLEPILCATMLFGCIEMALTTFVMGLLDRRDEKVIERAQEQVVEQFLSGLAERAAPVATPRATSRGAAGSPR